MTLKHRALNGVKWTSISTIIVTVLQLAQLSILARYLSPTDFGLMAIIMIMVGFTQVFMDMGVSNAIIQRKNITRCQLSSLYWLNIISGLVLSMIFAVFTPLISSFYGEPALMTPFWILSSVFIIVAIGNQYRVLCQKYMKFNIMAIIEMISAIISFFTAILLAYNEFGLYSLIAAMLVQATISSFLYFSVGVKYFQRPFLIFDHSSMSGFYSFGLYQMGERSINYISANIDKLLIGKLLGMDMTGIYNMAWQLVIFPLSKINPVVNKVAFPVYSSIQEEKQKLAKYYAMTVHTLSLVTIPLLTFLSFYSHEIIIVIFGKGWEQSAGLLPLLCLVGIFKAVSNPGGSLLLALGYANIGFWWNLFWSLILAGSIFLGLKLFPALETVPVVILSLSLTVGWFWHYLIGKVAKINCIPIILDFFKLTFISFGVAACSRFLVEFYSFDIVFNKLAVASSFCIAIYSIYLYLFERKVVNILIKRD